MVHCFNCQHKNQDGGKNPTRVQDGEYHQNRLNIGSLNVQGLNDKYKQQCIIEDLDKYNLNILAVQETKFKTTCLETITTKEGRTFNLYYPSEQNKYHGTALYVESSLSPEFTPVSNRICMATMKLNSNKINVLSVYAPTEERSRDNPKEAEEFYDEMEQIIQNISNRDFLVITGDFNARVGKQTEDFEDVIGKYAKGEKMSDNGRKLAEMCQRNNLILQNTVFKHKMAHRTTWTSPKQPKTPRRNLYRNQIDCILIRKQHLCLATNAKSYGGTTTTSDHKLVKANFNIKWHKMKFNKQTASPDHTQLRNPAIKLAYTEKVKEHLINKRKENETPQEKWTRICDACHQAAKEIIPIPMKNGRKNNEEIEKLSKQQQKLKNDLESTKNSKEQHKI